MSAPSPKPTTVTAAPQGQGQLPENRSDSEGLADVAGNVAWTLERAAAAASGESTGRSIEFRRGLPRRLPGPPPRLSKVTQLVWRACCNLSAKVALHPRPNQEAWKHRLGRLSQVTTFRKALNGVLQWQVYAEQKLKWMSSHAPKTKQPLTSLAELDELSDVDSTSSSSGDEAGWWDAANLPDKIRLSDAIAAMMHSTTQVGPLQMDLSQYLIDYKRTFRRRECIKAYSMEARVQAQLMRRRLQAQFKANGSCLRKFQLEAKLLAVELNKKKGDGVKLDSYTTSLPLREKFFSLQLKESHLVSEASLASCSLGSFKQLGRLYNSLQIAVDKIKQHRALLRAAAPRQMLGAKRRRPGRLATGQPDRVSPPPAPVPQVPRAGTKEMDRPEDPSPEASPSPSAQKRRQRLRRSTAKDGGHGGHRSKKSIARAKGPSASAQREVAQFSPPPGEEGDEGEGDGEGEGEAEGAPSDPAGSSSSEETGMPTMVAEALARMRKRVAFDNKGAHMQRLEDLALLREYFKEIAATQASARFGQLMDLMDVGHERLRELHTGARKNDEAMDYLQEALAEGMAPAVMQWAEEVSVSGDVEAKILQQVDKDVLKTKATVFERDLLKGKLEGMRDRVGDFKVDSNQEADLRDQLEELLNARTDFEEMEKEAEVVGQVMGSRPKRKPPVPPPKRRSTAFAAIPAKFEMLGRSAAQLHEEVGGIWHKGASEEGDQVYARIEEFQGALESLRRTLGGFSRMPAELEMQLMEDAGNRCAELANLALEDLEGLACSAEADDLPEEFKAAIAREQSARKMHVATAVDVKKAAAKRHKRLQQTKKAQDAFSKLSGQLERQRERNEQKAANNDALRQRIEDLQNGGLGEDEEQQNVPGSPQQLEPPPLAESLGSSRGLEQAREKEEIQGQLAEWQRRAEELRVAIADLEIRARGIASASPALSASPAGFFSFADEAEEDRESSPSPQQPQLSRSATATPKSPGASALASKPPGVVRLAPHAPLPAGTLKASEVALPVGVLPPPGVSLTPGAAPAQPPAGPAEQPRQPSVPQPSAGTSIAAEKIPAAQEGTVAKPGDEVGSAKQTPEDAPREGRAASGPLSSTPRRRSQRSAAPEASSSPQPSPELTLGSQALAAVHGQPPQASNPPASGLPAEVAASDQSRPSTQSGRSANVPVLVVHPSPENPLTPELPGQPAQPAQPSQPQPPPPGTPGSQSPAAIWRPEVHYLQADGTWSREPGDPQAGEEAAVPWLFWAQVSPEEAAAEAAAAAAPAVQEPVPELPPWEKMFPDDEPEAAKEKWEFCRTHKVERRQLEIPKGRRRLKFKLFRLVKAQKQELRLKTKLLMRFLSEEEAAALHAEIEGTGAPGKAAASQRADLERLTERYTMLVKLVDFWKRRVTSGNERPEPVRSTGPTAEQSSLQAEVAAIIDQVAVLARALQQAPQAPPAPEQRPQSASRDVVHAKTGSSLGQGVESDTQQATQFIRKLVHDIREACRKAHVQTERPVLSDVLLLPNQQRDGQEVLGSYLRKVAQLPEGVRSVVVEDLIQRERSRGISCMRSKDSPEQQSRLLACQETIRALVRSAERTNRMSQRPVSARLMAQRKTFVRALQEAIRSVPEPTGKPASDRSGTPEGEQAGEHAHADEPAGEHAGEHADQSDQPTTRSPQARAGSGPVAGPASRAGSAAGAPAAGAAEAVGAGVLAGVEAGAAPYPSRSNSSSDGSSDSGLSGASSIPSAPTHADAHMWPTSPVVVKEKDIQVTVQAKVSHFPEAEQQEEAVGRVTTADEDRKRALLVAATISVPAESEHTPLAVMRRLRAQEASLSGSLFRHISEVPGIREISAGQLTLGSLKIAPEADGGVRVGFNVANVELAGLEQDSHLMEDFKEAVQKAVADRATGPLPGRGTLVARAGEDLISVGGLFFVAKAIQRFFAGKRRRELRAKAAARELWHDRLLWQRQAMIRRKVREKGPAGFRHDVMLLVTRFDRLVEKNRNRGMRPGRMDRTAGQHFGRPFSAPGHSYFTPPMEFFFQRLKHIEDSMSGKAKQAKASFARRPSAVPEWSQAHLSDWANFLRSRRLYGESQRVLSESRLSGGPEVEGGVRDGDRATPANMDLRSPSPPNEQVRRMLVHAMRKDLSKQQRESFHVGSRTEEEESLQRRVEQLRRRRASDQPSYSKKALEQPLHPRRASSLTPQRQMADLLRMRAHSAEPPPPPTLVIPPPVATASYLEDHFQGASGAVRQAASWKLGRVVFDFDNLEELKHPDDLRHPDEEASEHEDSQLDRHFPLFVGHPGQPAARHPAPRGGRRSLVRARSHSPQHMTGRRSPHSHGVSITHAKDRKLRARAVFGFSRLAGSSPSHEEPHPQMLISSKKGRAGLSVGRELEESDEEEDEDHVSVRRSRSQQSYSRNSSRSAALAVPPGRKRKDKVGLEASSKGSRARGLALRAATSEVEGDLSGVLVSAGMQEEHRRAQPGSDGDDEEAVQAAVSDQSHGTPGHTPVPDQPSWPRRRRPALLLRNDLRQMAVSLQSRLRPRLHKYGLALEKKLGLPLPLIMQTGLWSGSEDMAALVGMSYGDAISTMRRKLLDLEGRYLDRKTRELSPAGPASPPVESTADEAPGSPGKEAEHQQADQSKAEDRSQDDAKLQAMGPIARKLVTPQPVVQERLVAKRRRTLQANARTHGWVDLASFVQPGSHSLTELGSPKQDESGETAAVAGFRSSSDPDLRHLEHEVSVADLRRPSRLVKPAPSFVEQAVPSTKVRRRETSPRRGGAGLGPAGVDRPSVTGVLEGMRGEMHTSVEEAFKQHLDAWREWRAQTRRQPQKEKASLRQVEEAREAKEAKEAMNKVERDAAWDRLEAAVKGLAERRKTPPKEPEAGESEEDAAAKKHREVEEVLLPVIHRMEGKESHRKNDGSQADAGVTLAGTGTDSHTPLVARVPQTDAQLRSQAPPEDSQGWPQVEGGLQTAEEGESPIQPTQQQHSPASSCAQQDTRVDSVQQWEAAWAPGAFEAAGPGERDKDSLDQASVLAQVHESPHFERWTRLDLKSEAARESPLAALAAQLHHATSAPIGRTPSPGALLRVRQRHTTPTSPSLHTESDSPPLRLSPVTDVQAQTDAASVASQPLIVNVPNPARHPQGPTSLQADSARHVRPAASVAAPSARLRGERPLKAQPWLSYLENWEVGDLEEYLDGLPLSGTASGSRPGTRLSRPSTRLSRPGTRTSVEQPSLGGFAGPKAARLTEPTRTEASEDNNNNNNNNHTQLEAAAASTLRIVRQGKPAELAPTTPRTTASGRSTALPSLPSTAQPHGSAVSTAVSWKQALTSRRRGNSDPQGREVPEQKSRVLVPDPERRGKWKYVDSDLETNAEEEEHTPRLGPPTPPVPRPQLQSSKSTFEIRIAPNKNTVAVQVVPPSAQPPPPTTSALLERRQAWKDAGGHPATPPLCVSEALLSVGAEADKKGNHSPNTDQNLGQVNNVKAHVRAFEAKFYKGSMEASHPLLARKALQLDVSGVVRRPSTGQKLAL